MNSSKTEYIIFGTNYQLSKLQHQTISVLEDKIEASSSMKLLGVNLDGSLSFKNHISNICKICWMNIRKIRTIRQFIDEDTCKTIVQGLITSYLNYCNVLYMGLPDTEMSKLQRVQNAAARLILNRSKYDSATEALKSLHWLRIRERTLFTAMCFVYRIIKEQAPRYLMDMLQRKPHSRALRSAQDELLFVVPKTTRHTFAFLLRVWTN